MAGAGKPQLTEEEMIAKKVKIRRIISSILGVIAVISIVAFIVLSYGTKQNINKQTSLDTQELRSKMKMIVSLENKYYEENGKYVSFNFLTICKDIPQYDPSIDGTYRYKFDAETKTCTGMEKDASSDMNGDTDGNDGLTLTSNWESGVIKGTGGANFFWPEEDLAEFQTMPKPKAPSGVPANAPADTTKAKAK
jgi:hypothetical protein